MNSDMSILCPHCGKKSDLEPNTNLDHILYKTWIDIKEDFFSILEAIHLVRTDYQGRYEMCGDEAHYVQSWRYTSEWIPIGPVLRKRKWWEHIIIKKR